MPPLAHVCHGPLFVPCRQPGPVPGERPWAEGRSKSGAGVTGDHVGRCDGPEKRAGRMEAIAATCPGARSGYAPYMPSSRSDRRSGRMATLSAVQETMALGEAAAEARVRDREHVKQRLVQMAKQRAPLPLDIERSARKLSLTPAHARRVLDGLLVAGQLESAQTATTRLRTGRPAAVARKKPSKQLPRARATRPTGPRTAGHALRST
jgi:hypothetical protein